MKEREHVLHSLKYARTLQCTHIDFSTPPLWLGRATFVAGLMSRYDWCCDAGLVGCLLPVRTVASLAVAVIVVVCALATPRDLFHH